MSAFLAQACFQLSPCDRSLSESNGLGLAVSLSPLSDCDDSDLGGRDDHFDLERRPSWKKLWSLSSCFE